MQSFTVPPWLRRTGAELALLAAVGVVMALLGPFETASRPLTVRFPYWLLCMVGGGVIGVGVDEAVRRIVDGFWVRLLSVSALMTPPVTLMVWLVSHLMFGGIMFLAGLFDLGVQVFVVCFATMALRQLAWAQAPSPVAGSEDRTDPTEAFRLRLSAKRRSAELIAVEAEDHYLRVHTDAGQELITARFGDALKELDAAPGFRTHRSWWVAASAIDEVKWLRGRGEARLKCGLTVPISRSNAAPIKAAGWF
jgi:hypothetical protein